MYPETSGAGRETPWWTLAQATALEGRIVEESQYQELFQSLGIWAGRLGSSFVMKYGGRSIQLYFIHNSNVGIYFSARRADEFLYPQSHWHHISPSGVKKKDGPEYRRFPVRPRHGMEREAFTNLVAEWRRTG